jgi:uncharacterized protein (DUF2141 family)
VKRLKIIALALGMALATPALAQTPDCIGAPTQTRLLVTVENVKAAQGTIRFTVYPDDPGRFLKRGGPIRGLSGLPVTATAPSTQACIWLPGPGGYALSIYHDANGNGRFDQNFIGLPLEGFGFSNNPTNLVSAPKLDQARITVGGGETAIHVRLRYL